MLGRALAQDQRDATTNFATILASGAVAVEIQTQSRATATSPSTVAEEASHHDTGRGKDDAGRAATQTNPLADDRRFHHTDILFTSHTNSFFTVPWFLAFDRGANCLVITIRGTLSLDDCITDAVAEPQHIPTTAPADRHIVCAAARLQQGFDMREQYVHGGMWRAAADVRDVLLRHGLLEAAGNRSPERTCRLEPTADVHRTCPNYAEGRTFPAYTFGSASGLVICGHSLGAGVATLLSLMLLPFYPDLHCFAFAPPGAIVSPGLAALMENWVTTLVVGKDMVPRLSLPSLQNLMTEIVDYTSRCKVNKVSLCTALCAQCTAQHGPAACIVCTHPKVLKCCCNLLSCNGYCCKVDPLLLPPRRLTDVTSRRSAEIFNQAYIAPGSINRLLFGPDEVPRTALYQRIEMFREERAVVGRARARTSSSLTASRSRYALGICGTTSVQIDMENESKTAADVDVSEGKGVELPPADVETTPTESTRDKRSNTIDHVLESMRMINAQTEQQALASTPPSAATPAPLSNASSRSSFSTLSSPSPSAPQAPLAPLVPVVGEPTPGHMQKSTVIGEPPSGYISRLSTVALRRQRFAITMSIPGNVIHLNKVNVQVYDCISVFFHAICLRRLFRCCDIVLAIFCCCIRSTRRVYEPRWTPRDNFKRVLVSAEMIRDHMPDVMADILHEVASDMRLGLYRQVVPTRPSPETDNIDADSMQV
jgi:hypothetical protein